uniref:GFA family protein n=1 Tax=uncultured Sphingomonas sp. TaxID=158754 RepID=UPI0035CC6AA5
MTETVTGGCQCGRVRYSVAIDDDDAYLCHCRMCQRATGGVSIAFKSVRIADLAWTTREPDRFQSSPIAQRGFCATCGTPLTFEFLKPGETMDLTVGSFDDSYRFHPTSHCSPETWHEEWLDTRGLAEHRLDENPATRDRWIEALGKLPD